MIPLVNFNAAASEVHALASAPRHFGLPVRARRRRWHYRMIPYAAMQAAFNVQRPMLPKDQPAIKDPQASIIALMACHAYQTEPDLNANGLFTASLIQAVKSGFTANYGVLIGQIGFGYSAWSIPDPPQPLLSQISDGPGTVALLNSPAFKV